MDLSFFPLELRERPQWMAAGAGDPSSPDYKRPISPKTKSWGSPTNPAHWGTYEEAAALGYPLVGYCFHESDPYAVIDLDTYKAKNEEVKQLHTEVLRHAQTYRELSQSGLGTHIICRGAVPEGAHNEANAIEIYSHARFMICTGRASQVDPVTDQQELLDYLYPLVKSGGAGGLDWRDLDQGEEAVLSDADLVEKICSAENGARFEALCRGDMSAYGNDHSAADMAFIQFLCFYTKDNQQVARIFHLSPLGQRDKAYRPDYVPRTIVRARQLIANDAPPPVNADAIKERAQAVANAAQAPQSAPKADEPPPLEMHVDPATFPPGLVGKIARYVLSASIRPVEEISLATAIAVVAGIASRNYNISSTGLNQYLLLLAKTGTGKESVQSSVDRLFTEVQRKNPAAGNRFIGPAAFSSGPALVKRFMEQPCFLSVLGEFGLLLKQMINPRANGAEKTLMRALLDIYGKSGWGQMLRPSVYSDKEKNTELVHAPALTILAETAPEPFFAGLDETAIENGFLPRFLVIEYEGDRPRRNRNAWISPPAELVDEVTALATSVLQMEQNGTCVVVQMDDVAEQLVSGFDEWVDEQMRGANEVARQLWNRAHLKVLRLAALIAVGVNPYKPTVTEVEASWAINMIKRDVRALHTRFIRGDVGEGEAKQHADLRKVIEALLKGRDDYAQRGCFAQRTLTQRVGNRGCFRNDRRGATRALKELLAEMVVTGELAVVPKDQAYDWFRTKGAVYCLGDMWNVE